MDIEETKNLILRRLTELREQQARQRRPQRPAAAAARPPERLRRSRMADWLGKGKPGPADLEARLGQLEERLVAMERCFLEADEPGPGPVAGARIRPVASEPPAGAPGARPGNAKAPPTRAPAEKNEAKDPYRLNGSVEDGLMTDVLQMLAANRKTGRFSLLLDSRQARFDVFFRDGEIIHAEAGELRGEAAFFALMTAGHSEGRYGFVEGDNDVPKTIEAQTHFIVLEALRRIDEGGNSEKKNPGQE